MAKWITTVEHIFYVLLGLSVESSNTVPACSELSLLRLPGLRHWLFTILLSTWIFRLLSSPH